MDEEEMTHGRDVKKLPRCTVVKAWHVEVHAENTKTPARSRRTATSKGRASTTVRSKPRSDDRRNTTFKQSQIIMMKKKSKLCAPLRADPQSSLVKDFSKLLPHLSMALEN